MKRAVYTAYGGPETIRMDTVANPVAGHGEVLVRVHASPVTAGDARMRSGKVPRGMGTLLRLVIGWNRPKVAPGWAYSGEVAALGAGVTQFAVGQRVFGITGFKGGAHAEYIVAKEGGTILPLPETLNHLEGAAFFFGGLTAAEFLIDKSDLQPRESLLVNGATGAVGSAALQLARHIGAKTTAVASKTNQGLARSLGADQVIDYRSQKVQGQFDVILDVIGTLPWHRAKEHLSSSGRLALITADLSAVIGAAILPRRAGKRVFGGTSAESRAKMQRLVDLHHAGAYRPQIGTVLPFEALAEAHKIAESFHKPGNLVVTMMPTIWMPTV